MTSMVAEDLIKPKEGLTELNPMSDKGAVKSGHEMERKLGLPVETTYKTSATESQIDQFRKRELNLISKYLFNKMRIERPLIKNIADLERLIQRELLDLIESEVAEIIFPK